MSGCGSLLPSGHADRMSQMAVIGDAAASFSVAVGARDADGTANLLQVRLRDVGLEASKTVPSGYVDGARGLVRFFEELAEAWRGWPDERIFESVEHDLLIVATHDGHVRLDVRLQQTTHPDGWRVEVSLRLDAGEQLARAARDVRAVVHG